MSFGNQAFRVVSVTVLLVAASCGGGGGGGGSYAIQSVVQDLTVDPDGLTTVITLNGTPAAVLPANFEADGGQTALVALQAGNVITVTWDERVTPSHEVRAVGLPATTAFRAVTTSDATVPTFTVTDGQQVPGLGGDTIEVTFAGVHVVEADVEDPDSWTLRVNGQALDLTGSTFTLDTNTQVLDITLGAMANLHAAFTLQATGVTSVADVPLAAVAVPGAAVGDAVAPTLVSANQNLAEDEFGRVVDFQFSEAMDPVFSTGLARFGVTLPDVATSVTQPIENVLRVTFSGPVIPGVDNVTLTGLVDAHGNAFGNGPQAVAQPAPVANAYDGNPAATTVENELNDTITIVTTQAFDPDSAEDPASWAILVDGAPIVVADQTLEYDFLAKTLTITLDFDMQNGVAFDVTGNNVLDVDGQTFALAFGGVVAGDVGAPTVTSVQQNRTFDTTGRTVDVRFSEDVDPVEATNLANFGVTGGINVLTATLLGSLDTVRLTLDAPAVPTDVTFSVQAIEDLAGNPMAAPQVGLAVTSTDAVAPAITGVTANAVEGADDDTLVVLFDDLMVEAEVEDGNNWTFESPVGNAQAVTGATIEWDAGARRATLTFDAGTTVDLKRGDGFRVAMTGMRDLGGNAVGAGALTGNVTAESNLPEVHTIARDDTLLDRVSIRFSEPCGQLDDLYDAGTNPDGTRYVLRDSGGVLRGHATTASIEDDGLGVRVGFGIVVAPTDTVDVIGVEDLAGNPLFPAMTVATVAEDLTLPSLDAGFSTLLTVEGDRNDVVTVVFDRPLSPWRLLEPSNYALVDGVTPVELDDATFAFDGDRTVTITLPDGVDLLNGTGYDLTVDQVRTAQGIQRVVPETEVAIAAGGDVAVPLVLGSGVRVDPLDANSLLIQVDEAVAVAEAETAANYDYNTGTLADSSQRIGPRTIRATFAGPPTVGFPIDVTVTDLAGNTVLYTRSVTAADAAAPLIVNVSGTAVANRGGDFVTVRFSEPVDPDTALDASHFAVHNNGGFLDLSSASFEFDSVNLAVVIRLGEGEELDVGTGVTATITGIADFAGNAIGSVVVGGTVSGDNTAPTIASSFVNLRNDPASRVIDVLFSEDIDEAFVETLTNWSASGAQAVTAATLVDPSHVRIELASPLGALDTLNLVAGVEDLARNAAGALVTTPVH